MKLRLRIGICTNAYSPATAAVVKLGPIWRMPELKKSAKRLLRANMNERGDLDSVAITRALLEYRNTPDRDVGLSPAELLYGRNLKDFLPDKPDKCKKPKHELLKEEYVLLS